MIRFASLISSTAAACLFIVACMLTTGCASNRPMSDEGFALAVRIAVRHAVADSPRAYQKAENIRAAVIRLQAVVTSASTVSALRSEVITYLDTLELNELERADAVDVLDYFAAIVEARVGEEPSEDARLIKVQEFLRLVLAALPAAASARS